MRRGTRITASWYSHGGSLGVLLDAATGHELARGTDSLEVLVGLEKPTDVVIMAGGHRPMRMTLTPEMSSARISEGATLRGQLPSFEVSYSYPDMDAVRERAFAANLGQLTTRPR